MGPTDSKSYFCLTVLSVNAIFYSGASAGRGCYCVPCFYPMSMWVHPGVTKNGRPVYKFEPCRSRPLDKPVKVPCGKCVGCRLEYSRQWANRCMLELQYHDSAYFVTLTYDDYHVPRSAYADPDTGEALQALTLCKRDWQLFMKRLRFAFPDDKLRFFMCGEYGDQTQRPHYHAIIFGLHLQDLVPWKKSSQGYQYYLSESLQRCWSVKSEIDGLDGEKIASPYLPIGHILVGEVTWETCAYTARYIMKKLTGPMAQYYEFFNLEAPFVLMSRRPGIARQYFVDHPDMYDFDYINIKTDKGGRKFHPPRYFDRLFDIEHHDELAEIKKIRKKQAEIALELKLSATDLREDELLAVEESNLVSRISSLQRKEF